ncbi:hypothetical protein [Roseibacillus ishigakijimensis]|uniref:Uncharacterized protein n=1 Tax=Roseibacillus ishigakijimensis TaxID=454146 RepID=A0A934VK86_9BACT|nr:hypothetical protein [Roseibacillus ishigakijimensis]MBK1833389.1 hypothetical protein [Roseibacillus ishigakijimensis]
MASLFLAVIVWFLIKDLLTNQGPLSDSPEDSLLGTSDLSDVVPGPPQPRQEEKAPKEETTLH